jgi:hypothetical protein
MDSKEYLQNKLQQAENKSIHNTISVLEQLSDISAEPNVAGLDCHGQIERWNRYQDLLDKIDEKCLKTQGDVWLKRNIKHNVKVLTYPAIVAFLTICQVALLLIVAGATTHTVYPIIGGIIALAFVGWQMYIRIHAPSMIHFKCRPILHIDEYAYMNKAISRIPKAQRDPIVALPKLQMSIPRSWLAQQGMLEFMESLKDIKLEEVRG